MAFYFVVIHIFDSFSVLTRKSRQFVLKLKIRESINNERLIVDHRTHRTTWDTFQLELEKKNKKTLWKRFLYFFKKNVFLIFLGMQLSSPKLKNLLCFFQKVFFKFFLIFQEGTCKAWKTKISYIPWNGTF